MTTLAVPIPDNVVPGDSLVLYGSFDTPLDFDQPPIAQPIPAHDEVLGVWANSSGPGFLLDRWLVDPWLGGIPGGRFLEGPWLEQPWLQPRPVRFIEIREVYGFGSYTVSVVVRDRHGQESGDPPVEFTFTFVGAPLGVDRMTFNNYNAGTDRVTFDLTHLAM